MGTNRVPVKGDLVGLLGLSCWYKRFLFCLGYCSLPTTKYFSLSIHYFNYFVPIAQQARQAAMLGRLSLSMCLWSNTQLPILFHEWAFLYLKINCWAPYRFFFNYQLILLFVSAISCWAPTFGQLILLFVSAISCWAPSFGVNSRVRTWATSTMLPSTATGTR